MTGSHAVPRVCATAIVLFGLALRRFVICFDRRTNSLGVEMMHRGKAIKCEPTLRDLARTDSVREVYRRRRERLILGTGVVLGVMILGIGVRAFF
jgi:hypothetical protein